MQKNKIDDDDARELIPKAQELSAEEIEARLKWIEAEIRQLSSQLGVAERIKALQFAQAQLVAAKSLSKIMVDARQGGLAKSPIGGAT